MGGVGARGPQAASDGVADEGKRNGSGRPSELGRTSVPRDGRLPKCSGTNDFVHPCLNIIAITVCPNNSRLGIFNNDSEKTEGFWSPSSTIEVAPKDVRCSELFVPQDQCLHHIYSAALADSMLRNVLMKNIIEYALVVSSQPKAFLLRLHIVTKLEARVHLISLGFVEHV